ncbi:peptidoglycan-binding domain-containing protein [Actinocorallia populi]|uniref:peptidoglycan-binding domain-containing protein n=1 Tax=Actinocorallia populi TaxID=2079200 RepID=UPI000D096105|nr:peptidoglycan-binding domain-containing protein [Actinocorallia populi]
MHKASFALAASLTLALSLGSPAGAAASPFADNAEAALEKIDPGLEPSEEKALQSKSVLDEDQAVKEDHATFRSQGRALVVMRSVGAVPPVSGEIAVGRSVQKKKVQRARAGVRNVVIYNTAEDGVSGLTVAAWSERDGVNYRIASRDALSRGDLIKLVKALPADTTKPSRKARRAIESAPPAERRPEPVQRSTSSLFVDGAGDPGDDLGDEANLCNGCAYSYSNYVWMWQRILQADAFLVGSMDCSFGPLTTSGTKNWQSDKGLTSDGIVGANTRKRADDYILDGGGTSVFYLGEWQNAYFHRLTNNAYHVSSKRMNYTNATMC